MSEFRGLRVGWNHYIGRLEWITVHDGGFGGVSCFRDVSPPIERFIGK